MKSKLSVVALAAMSFAAHAQTASTAPTTKYYTFPRPGALYDGSTRVNQKDYWSGQECLDDLEKAVKAKRALNPSAPVVGMRCRAETGGVSELVQPGKNPPPPVDPDPIPPVKENPPVTSMPPGILAAKPFPVGSAGYSTERLSPFVPGTGLPGIQGPYDVGAFRLQCQASHVANDDPIVYPGQPGRSHLHTFFGNTTTDAYSTNASLVAKGNSTCNGGTINRTGYWAPSMINMTTKQVVMPAYADFYYKTGYGGVKPADVKPYPAGLRMIAGDPMNRRVGTGQPYRYICHNTLSATGGLIEAQTFVSCPVGDYMSMEVFFPQCWDGKNLDSPDHKSHMAYPAGNGCPQSHPVALPEYSMHIHYLVTAAGVERQWKLSSDDPAGVSGTSAHADWENGWNPARMATWVRECLNKAMTCHSHLLDGQTVMY